MFITSVWASERVVVAQAAGREGEGGITLKPSEGVDYRLTMKAAKVNFWRAWT